MRWARWCGWRSRPERRCAHDGLRLQLSFPNRHPANMGAPPFEAGAIRAMLADHDLILMLGGPFFEEVWFDAVRAVPETVPIVQIAPNHPVLARNFELAAGVVGDPAAALEALAGVVADMASAQFEAAAAQRRATLEQRHAERRAQGEAALRSRWDALPMLPGRALLEVAAALPEDVIVVDESITAGRDVQFAFEFAAAGDYFGQRGGGIGQGIAGALGVKIANPERPVLCISGDGSAMYHIQSLWTAANLGLDIVFVILANREYRVLKHNLDIYRRRFDAASNNPYPFMDFTPAMDFAALASGLGVAGVRISDPAALQAAVQRAFAAGGPHLIEVAVSGKES
ncbi:MAG: thiamine pyrophosphate-dependent enzyme [Pseudomonadales bacterium]